ncbi:hypothetical protein AQUCO_07200091v1 [Aquilegia coerulea]|uniref:Water stress and hypersensitive response domain-containing protein n=1 Tax=Aquilegia coerulea TaxID=218851 RepID=A0A2G5CAA4_AQUCA|nr:hypothetical protein AQUCO_07200091v1 [Aquilegia coerulea]
MGKKVKWSWSSALIGAATATATTAFIFGRPKDPSFHLLNIKPTSVKLNLPVLHTDLILTVHVTNPNIVPIQYSSSSMSIFYHGSLLGTAKVEAGSQPAMSCRMLKLPARLDGLKLTHQRLFSDVKRREMVLDAVVDIEGIAKVLWWAHKFNVHVDSRLIVDPLFLDVIEQESKSILKFFLLERSRLEG